MVTPDAKRKAVAHLVEGHQVCQRRACSALDVDQSTVRYQSRRDNDTELRGAMKAVAKERHRFGYRQLQVMVERQGWQGTQKTFRRIYIARRSFRCVGGEAGSVLWALEGRWLCRMAPIRDGAWTSYLMR